MMSLANNGTTAGTMGVKPGVIVNGQADGGKFLTFFLAGEEYGIEILKVHEIIGMRPITPVPRTPEYIRGVINLRGKVITVVDLRMKFGMESKEPTDLSCIIVVQTAGVEIGIMVDQVSEVVDIAPGDIDNTPSFGPEVDTDYILGIGKLNDKVRLLLDIDKVLSNSGTVEIQKAAERAVA